MIYRLGDCQIVFAARFGLLCIDDTSVQCIALNLVAIPSERVHRVIVMLARAW